MAASAAQGFKRRIVSTMPAKTVDVVVVGAGLSGLRAALDLDHAGLSFVVLEAMNRVGGKTFSKRASAQGGMVDLGAAWINDTNQSEMYQLAQEFGFDLKVQRATGLDIFEDEHGVIHERRPGEDHVADKKFPASLAQLAESTNLEFPHQSEKARELDAVTFAEWAAGFSPEASSLANDISKGLLGEEAADLSLLFMLNYIKSGTGLANLVSDCKHGGQYLRNRQGNQTFSIRIAERLQPGSVKLACPVTRITQHPSKSCTVETENGAIYECKKVIVSVPTSLYHMIDFVPALPPPKRQLAETTLMGFFAKVVLVYERPWWRDLDWSGTFSSVKGPIGFTRDTCVEEDRQYSITCFMVGDIGRIWSKFPQPVRKGRVLNQFHGAAARILKDPSIIPAPINIIEQDWSKEPWIRGNPNPVMPPGLMTSEAGKSIAAPVGDIHFVGTETAVVWKGYMEGAVRSGVRGAAEVIGMLQRPAPASATL